MDKELLEAISQILDVKLDAKLGSIHKRLDDLKEKFDCLEGRMDHLEERVVQVEEKVDRLIEAHEETRSGVNSLLDWADLCSNAIKLPLPRIR